MVGCHHRLNGSELEQALAKKKKEQAMGVHDGQENLAYGSPQGHKELDMTNSEINWKL